MSASLIESAAYASGSRLNVCDRSRQTKEDVGKPDLPYIEAGNLTKREDGTHREHATAKQSTKVLIHELWETFKGC